MSESRAIYYNNEWNEIRDCQECKFIKYTDYPRSRYSCADDISIGGCDIPDGCRLPLWDLVRDYGPDEIPDDDRDVLLSIKHKDEDGIEIAQAYYDYSGWNYTHNDDTIPSFYKVVSWRHIL